MAIASEILLIPIGVEIPAQVSGTGPLEKQQRNYIGDINIPVSR